MLASTSYQSILQEESQTIDLLSIQRDKYEKCKKKLVNQNFDYPMFENESRSLSWPSPNANGSEWHVRLTLLEQVS